MSRVPLTKSDSVIPAPGEWALCYRQDGSFAQQVVVQLVTVDALRSIIMHTNGSGIRVGGKNLAVEIRSMHPDFAPAGSLAQNMLLDVVNSVPDGGQCL